MLVNVPELMFVETVFVLIKVPTVPVVTLAFVAFNEPVVIAPSSAISNEVDVTLPRTSIPVNSAFLPNKVPGEFIIKSPPSKVNVLLAKFPPIVKLLDKLILPPVKVVPTNVPALIVVLTKVPIVPVVVLKSDDIIDPHEIFVSTKLVLVIFTVVTVPPTNKLPVTRISPELIFVDNILLTVAILTFKVSDKKLPPVNLKLYDILFDNDIIIILENKILIILENKIYYNS